MKQIFTIFLAVFALSFSYAQSFSVSSLSEQINLDGTNEVAIEVTVQNLTSDTISISWERTETRLPDGWKNNICDPQKCYTGSSSSEMFTLPGNGSGTFSVHCTPTTVDYAIIDIKFFPTGQPDQAVTGTYTFGQVTGTNDLAVAPIALYPNPATNYFQVENGQKVNSIEMFNILGVKILESTDTDHVNVSQLKSGLYFVRLLDRTEKIITTQRLQKN